MIVIPNLQFGFATAQVQNSHRFRPPFHKLTAPHRDISHCGLCVEIHPAKFASPNTSKLLSDRVHGYLQVIRGYRIVYCATLLRAVMFNSSPVRRSSSSLTSSERPCHFAVLRSSTDLACFGPTHVVGSRSRHTPSIGQPQSLPSAGDMLLVWFALRFSIVAMSMFHPRS